MIAGSRISVEDTATALNTPNGGGQRLRLKNTGAAAIDLGSAGVVTGEGYELAIDAELEVALGPDEQLFGISGAAATNIVEVLTT